MILSAGTGAATARANCTKAPDSQRCLGCAHEMITMEPAKSGTTVHGTVQDSQSKPFEGVLVEVFTHPEVVVPMLRSGASVEEFRVAACLVGKDGKFSFHLGPGKYEMRFSRSFEWNCTFLQIQVIENYAPKRLRIEMSIGT
jgi:hypothetical protein